MKNLRPTYFRIKSDNKVLDDISIKLTELLEKSCRKCHSRTISLSGGLDSTILASLLGQQIKKAIAVVSEDFVATDLTYCQMASNKLKIPLEINKASTAKIISSIQETIKILKNFNDIEIRNNVVMYIVMDWLKQNQLNRIITGDGADELFAGYSFLMHKSESELQEELKRIKEIMHFPSQKIGKALGIVVESPFLDKEIIEFSAKIPANLKIAKKDDKIFGKWILRKTFEDRIPPQIAWREKSPMQDGAGTSKLTNLFEILTTDEKFQKRKKQIEEEDNVIIRTKESLYYYEIFRKYFENPQSLHASDAKCPFCKYQIQEDSRFCRMCGTFPI